MFEDIILTLEEIKMMRFYTEEETMEIYNVEEEDKEEFLDWLNRKIDAAIELGLWEDTNYEDTLKELNQASTQTMKKMNQAKKMTLEEIAALPRGAVIWCEWIIDAGEVEKLKFFSLFPVMVTFPGMGGSVCGEIGQGCYFSRDISEESFSDPNCIYWNVKPDPEQLKDDFLISEEEYNRLSIAELKQLVKQFEANQTAGKEV